MRIFITLGLLLSFTALNACTPLGVAIGAGAGVGVAAAQEGGISGAIDDKQIQLHLNDLWLRHDAEMFRKLDMTVHEGRVLLTGVVQKQQQRVDAVRLAWETPGVKQVINEVKVSEGAGVLGYAEDALISTKVKSKLTLERGVLSINYNVDVVDKTVYLMGVAQDRNELNKVLYLARNTANVREVVSYVRMKAPTATQAANYQQNTGQPVQREVYQNAQPMTERRTPGGTQPVYQTQQNNAQFSDYNTYDSGYAQQQPAPVSQPNYNYNTPASGGAQPVIDPSQQQDVYIMQQGEANGWNNTAVSSEPLY